MGSYATPDSYIVSRYLRKCRYKISERSQETYENSFEFYSGAVQNGKLRPCCADISGEFIYGLQFDYTELQFGGPGFHSECLIYNINKINYTREFGFIQTSKKYYKRSFDNAISYIDFQSNLLSNRDDEVLDTDGTVNPFYSQDSYYVLPAGQIPEGNIIKLIFHDYPTSRTYVNYSDACLQMVERHQQFFIYVVMRYIKANGQYQYDVLHTFDWFLYFNWFNKSREENYKYEYNYGVNIHRTTRTFPCYNIFEVCNNDQLEYLINLTTGQFYIINYPEIQIEISDHETYSIKIANAVIRRNQREEEEDTFL